MEKKGLLILLILGLLYWFTKSPTYNDDSTGIELIYHVETTPGASRSEMLPMIIALHGNGDTVDNFYGYSFKDFSTPARIILIQAPDKYWPYDLPMLTKYSEAIANLSQVLQQDYPTLKKPMLFGFSGGGVMAYFSALTQCDHYSTIMPVSGKLTPQMIPDNISTDDSCRVSAFHGKNDRVVSFSDGQYAIAKLKEYSRQIETTSFNGDHLGMFREFKDLVFDKLSLLLSQ